MRKNSNFIGYTYPFFLNNNKMDTYYLYRIGSPEMLSDFTPLLTFSKIGEKTDKSNFCASEKYGMSSGDIIATLMKSRKDFSTKATQYLEENILGENSKAVVFPNKMEFPLYEMDNQITKTLIIGLRDNLRWAIYKFRAGNFVDILLTPTKFGVFEIIEKDGGLTLDLRGVYKMTDVNLSNPLPVDLNKVNYPKEVFKGDKVASDMNRAIRSADWKSFDTKEF